MKLISKTVFTLTLLKLNSFQWWYKVYMWKMNWSIWI